MAMINMNNGRENRRSKPTKRNLRVDFTLNMLLITFFMFCTTLKTPQMMDVVVPTKEVIENPMEIPRSKTITLLLGEEDKVYYYASIPDYKSETTLKMTDFTESGMKYSSETIVRIKTEKAL